MEEKKEEGRQLIVMRLRGERGRKSWVEYEDMMVFCVTVFAPNF